MPTIMHPILSLPTDRGGADDTELEFDDLKLVKFLALKCHRSVKPCGIGAVGRVGCRSVDLDRSVNILPEGKCHFQLRARMVGIGRSGLAEQKPATEIAE